MTAEWVMAAVLAVAALVLLGCVAAGIWNAVRGRRTAGRHRAEDAHRTVSRDEALAIVRGAVWTGAMSREDALRSILLAYPDMSEQTAADLLDRDTQFDRHCDTAGVVDDRPERAR